MAASLAAAPGCGGDGGDGSGGSGGSGTNSSSASTGGGGPCVPWGTWEIKYMGGSEGCAPMTDSLTVSPGAEAGMAQIAFASDDPMPMDTCTDPPTTGNYFATCTVSADGCTLTIDTATAYCLSGEDQCESRDLILTISGETATGNLTYKKCWCGGNVDAMPVMATATATRTM